MEPTTTEGARDGAVGRRRLLAGAAGALVAALAGCPAMETPFGPADDGTTAPGPTATATDAGAGGASPVTGDGDDGAGATSPTGADDGAGTAPADGTGTPATTTPALDIREANVVGVEVTRDGDDYRFDVTLYHDDDGEDGYADWWQVETPAGGRLGRRKLLHAHGTRPFTRSATVRVPADAPCVVVRGHDRTHGYGGQAMVVTVETGARRAVRQGPEPRTFDGVGCP